MFKRIFQPATFDDRVSTWSIIWLSYIYIYIPWSFHYSWYSMISPLIFLLFPWYSHYFPLIFLLKSYLSKLPAAARTSKQGAHGPAALSLGTLDQNVLRMVGISLVTSGYSWYVYRWFSYIYIYKISIYICESINNKHIYKYIYQCIYVYTNDG